MKQQGAVMTAALLCCVNYGCEKSENNTSPANTTQDTTKIADTTMPYKNEALSGGKASLYITGKDAYSKPSANMPMQKRGEFLVGNDFFTRPWVSAPASTTARDGLGSLFNVNACQACHIKDGRGHAPLSETDSVDSLLIRLLKPNPDVEARYGLQIQDRALPGVKPEAKVIISYKSRTLTFKDGEKIVLREPKISLQQLEYGPIDRDTLLSPRVASPMIGMGLLAAIPENALLKTADPDDLNDDNISGRIHWHGDKQIGRFGWKAEQPTLEGQVSSAFRNDIGITNKHHPTENCAKHQQACLKQPNGVGPEESHEISDDLLALVTFYSRHLSVPARRNLKDPQVSAGKALFKKVGCDACHVASYQIKPLFTDPQQPAAVDTLFPYTDLLLHDMGDDLADKTLAGDTVSAKISHLANEWRTPPLWGIGLAKAVSPQATFLHDGRARTLMEAILWHGGEAKSSQQQALNMSKAQRTALLAFLNSL